MKSFIAASIVAIALGGSAFAAAPAGTPPAGVPAGGVAWSSLSREQKRLLEQFQSNWDQLPAQRRFALARGADTLAENE